jgi:integrase
MKEMAKRRGNNEGSLSQREDGTWRGQISVNGNRISYSAKTRKEVTEWLKHMRNQIDAGLNYEGASTALDEFFRNWLISIKTTIRPGTHYQYEMTCRVHIRPILGKVKLKDLSALMIQNLYDTKSKEGVSARTVKMIHVVLHRSLSHAVKLGMIGLNPTKRVTPPKYRTGEMKFYDESQVNQMLLAARGNRNEVLYHLAVVTGLRQSELLALHWVDLNWQDRTLKIQRQLKRDDHDNGFYTSPKTKAGKRIIVLGAVTIQKLREQFDRVQEERRAVGERWQENDLMFPSTVGTPINQMNLYRSFKGFIREVGLPDIRFHDLRHTAASLMLNHGIPPIVVARRLGHSKVSITLDTYGHLMPGMQNEAADLMDELVTPVEVQLHQIAPKLHRNE